LITEEWINEYEIVEIDIMLRAYNEHYGIPCYRTISTEQAWTMPLYSPRWGRSRTFELRGKIDAVIKTERGEQQLMEHKTSSEDIAPGSDYWRRLRLDTQCSSYILAAQYLGFDTSTCVYNVLGKIATKPKPATPEEKRRYTKGKRCEPCAQFNTERGRPDVINGEPNCIGCEGSGWLEKPRLYSNLRDVDETPAEYSFRLSQAYEDHDRYFVRQTVTRLDSELTAHRYNVWNTAEHIKYCMRHNSWPQHTRQCRNCVYLPLCIHEAEPTDARYKSEPPHTELND
jgi:hypothetical protein